jgi:release factor glutamine methyltransferase
MTVAQAIRYGTENFRKYAEIKASAHLDALVLLGHCLGENQVFLYSHPEYNLTAAQVRAFNQAIARRQQLTPVAYITGKKEFYGRNFVVSCATLIPRPETELIIETVKRGYADVLKNKPHPLIIDIGTGSGCIAITLAKECPGARLVATDISPAAIAVARKNTRLQHVNIAFVKGDLLKPAVFKNLKPDILVANLPYVEKSSLNTSQKKILAAEPSRALFANRSGLEYYEGLFRHMGRRKISPQLTICEFSPIQKHGIIRLVNRFFPQKKYRIIKDLTRRNRVLVIN